MRIATWNVNSLRARLDRVVGWLEREQPDVLALQETKCTATNVPLLALEATGYEVAHHGMSQWNGVAILSRVGMADVQTGFEGMPTFGNPPAAEARAISARCGDVHVWSLYVPNGRTPTDPHYGYKVTWLDALGGAGRSWLAEDPTAQVALCGDFNVAPHDEDVWDMAAFEGGTHVTEPERKAFAGLVDAGYADVVRPHCPGPGTYTFWDYQQLRFPRREGMRIDFILGSPAFADRVVDARIDREERKGKGASDHAPVVVDIEAG
jgi:exodeoxyribonuclease III